ncbi:LuxR C-terminal-related transcriptional regulator [Paenibacillus alginolyticus]
MNSYASKETRIVRLVVSGLSNKEIAHRLSINGGFFCLK